MKTATFKALKPLVLDSQMSCLAGSGAFAASGGFDGAIRLFGLEDQSLKETGKGTGLVGWVTSLAFGKGGLLAGTDSQGNAAAWRDGKPAWSRPALSGAWLRKVAVSPDGQMVAVVGRDGIPGPPVWNGNWATTSCRWHGPTTAKGLPWAIFTERFPSFRPADRPKSRSNYLAFSRLTGCRK